MYLFALLFLSGFIYNLVIGNYIEAIWGITIAAILIESKFFWDVSDGLTTYDKLKSPIGIGAIIILIALFANYIVTDIEINSQTYIKVAEIKQDYPTLNAVITKAISDGKISVVEYYDIENQYFSLSKARAIEVINSK